MKRIVQVILPIALDKEFDYSCSSNLGVKSGMRVVVDFKGKKKVGLVAGVGRESCLKDLKPIIELLDNEPLLGQEHIQFANKLSKIYPYAKGQFLFMMIPPYLKRIRKSGFQKVEAAAKEEGAKAQTANLSQSLATFIKADSFTQRYQQWKDKVREKLRQGSVLICFPQLSYLHQAKKILEKDFEGKTTVIHSQQNERELFLNWQKTRKNALILGTRVAAFYFPLDLGLIILEEENSPYYFQEEKPFYHLLDVVLVLSKIKNSGLILSADFPSLTAYKHIQDKQIQLKDMTVSTKNIKVVNITEFSKRKIVNPIFSEILRKTLQENKKGVVLWNKKGFARAISCSACGHVLKCDRCSAFLQLTSNNNQGVCPYCQKRKTLPQVCDKCNSGYFKSAGYGLERVGAVLKRIFPEKQIDSWQNYSSRSEIILSTTKILSSLYGPQIFDVGFVLDADFFLMRPDYTAAFRTFLYLKKLSLLFREDLYVFTRNKDYYLFKCLNQPWQNFYRQELKFRKEVHLPPFGLIAQITLRAKNKNKLLEKANDLYNRLAGRGQEVYGPFEEYPFKLRDKFRYSLIIKGKRSASCRKIIKEEVLETRAAGGRLAASLR